MYSSNWILFLHTEGHYSPFRSFCSSVCVYFAVAKLHIAALQSMTFSPTLKIFSTHIFFFPLPSLNLPHKPPHTLSDSVNVSPLHHMFLGVVCPYPPCCSSRPVLFLNPAPASLPESQPFPPTAPPDPWLGVLNSEATGALCSAGSCNGVIHITDIPKWTVKGVQNDLSFELLRCSWVTQFPADSELQRRQISHFIEAATSVNNILEMPWHKILSKP